VGTKEVYWNEIQGFHVKTKPFPATFPLLFGDKFVMEKTFPGKGRLHVRFCRPILESVAIWTWIMDRLRSIYT
jgi:hypothetical protein